MLCESVGTAEGTDERGEYKGRAMGSTPSIGSGHARGSANLSVSGSGITAPHAARELAS